MGGHSYTLEQLEALRESPLVKKPEGLPNITQWMDVPADNSTNNNNNNNNNNQTNNGTARRVRGVREGEASAPADQRSAVNPMGQFGRRQSMQPGEETVLGPPKFSFASASRSVKAPGGEAKERTGIVSTDGDNLGDRFPREKNERWTRGGVDADRTRDKAYTNGRRAPRDDEGGWTVAKGRKSVGQEDFERFSGRNGDRNRDKQEGDMDMDAAPRRGTRDRAEPRWGRREETKDEGVKTGGWRERDQNRDRDRDRDWTRGGNRAEEDPEWMDTKIEKKEAPPRTAEDFQAWKASMKAKNAPAVERDEYAQAPTAATAATVPPMLTQALHTPSAEPTQGILFGNWGRDKAAELPPAESMSTKPKTDKKSRFMNMFAKPEEPAAPSQPSMPMLASLGPAGGGGGDADQEGFQRILQMLGQVNVGGPSPGPAPQATAPPPTNGARHGGGVSLDMFQQSPLPASQNNKPPRNLEQRNLLDNILAQRPMTDAQPSQQSRYSSMSPDNAMQDQFRLPRESSHPDDHFVHQQPPSRGPMPDANLSALLSGRARAEQGRDQDTKQKERDFLLTLMQQPSRATPPQQPLHNLPRQNQNQENHLAAFFDQPRQQPQAPPKGRSGLPPGFMEDPRMFNENDMARREAERREQELRQQLNMQQQHQQQQHQEAMRAKNARLPMGYPNHDDAIMNLQRRNTAGDSRQLTNMGIPSQAIPDLAYMGGRGQQGMPPAPQERSTIPPPPGFGGGPMRQPPGLNGLNPQQQQQMGPGPSFSAGNTPIGHPPGFAPPDGMRGMGFLGGNGMQAPPQSMPQGYFPQSGYGPGPMGGMPREDPRMMFDGPHPGFGGGPGPRQQPQGRPGPPGMY